MRLAMLVFTALLVACEGDDTKSADDTDAETEETDPVEDASDPPADDTDPVVDDDPLGLTGTWSGVLDVTERTVGSFNGNPFDNQSRCATGSATFAVDPKRAPHVAIETFTCVEVNLGTVTMTGGLAVDGEGDPVVTDHTVSVSGSVSSDQFAAGMLPWVGTFYDDDADGVMDRLALSADGVVGSVSNPSGGATTTLAVSFEGTRSGD